MTITITTTPIIMGMRTITPTITTTITITTILTAAPIRTPIIRSGHEP
jgi:hypothetical protein